MTDTTKRTNIEDAYYFVSDAGCPKHRQKLANWGAVYTLVAVVGMPLFITFGVPFIASLFR